MVWPSPKLESHRQVVWISTAGDKSSPKSCCNSIFVWFQAHNSRHTLRRDKRALAGIDKVAPKVLPNIFCSRCRSILKNLVFSGFSWIHVNKGCPSLLFFSMNTKIAAACQVCWEMDVIIFNWTVSPKGTQQQEIDRCSMDYLVLWTQPNLWFVAGAKEIDIAATLEHLRDQRPGMVQTKVLSINPLGF